MVYFRGKRQTVVDTRISNQKFNAQQGNGLVQVLDLEIGKGRQEIRFLFSIIAALILASKIFCLNDYEQAITSWIKPGSNSSSSSRPASRGYDFTAEGEGWPVWSQLRSWQG